MAWRRRVRYAAGSFDENRPARIMAGGTARAGVGGRAAGLPGQAIVAMGAGTRRDALGANGQSASGLENRIGRHAHGRTAPHHSGGGGSGRHPQMAERAG